MAEEQRLRRVVKIRAARIRSEGANTYIETIMVLLVFFALVAIVFVASIAAFRYTILTDAVSQGLMSVSTDASAGNSNTTALGPTAITQATNYLRDTFGWNDTTNIKFWACVRSTGSGASCRTTVELNGKWTYNCFFCPRFKINTWDIRVKQTRDVEDAIFRVCSSCGGAATSVCVEP